MKRSLEIILLFCSTVFLAISCEHEVLNNDKTIPCELEVINSDKEFEGTWLWIMSKGGFGGWTITPESEGYNMTVLIDENTYTELRNCSIIYQVPYTFTIDSIYGTYGYLDLNPGGHLGVRVNGDSLELIEPCCDGYIHFYKRN